MEKYKLYMSLRSPFARRVRLLLEELSVPYDIEVVDVFNPPASYFAINPLGRVPALALPSGEPIVDSTEIVAHLREIFCSHSLFTTYGAREPRVRTMTALTLGIMEHTVQAFLETLRPPALRLESVREDALNMIHRALRVLEREFKGPYVLGDNVTFWDLDLGSALAYCDLRLGSQVVNTYPTLRMYLKHLNERASFQKTVPPA